MSIHIIDRPVPLIVDQTGVIRVGGSRVTLETIVGSFRQGASAEEIAQQYPVVLLADIYEVIGYYLHHQKDVDEYLREIDIEADCLRTKIEQRFPADGIRDRLVARLSQQNRDTNLAPGK